MMKDLPKIFSFIAAVILSWSCQEIIDLDLNQAESKIVLEGKITDDGDIRWVKLSKSLNYYDTGKLPPISNATVTLLDANDNEVERFSYSERDSTYKSFQNATLEIGQEYKIQIEVDNEILEASGNIFQNATLDSIYYLSTEQLKEQGLPAFGEGYFMFVDGALNNEGIEYFRLEVTVNDTLRDGRGDISNSILTSEFFGKQFVGLPVPGSFEEEDTVMLELYTLDEDVYQYYIEFINLLFNDGGVFSPPPVNPTTNIVNLTNPENIPLGFVQFGSVIKYELIIEAE